MFKKILLLSMMETLPMFACGPTISPEGAVIIVSIFIVSLIVIMYGLVKLFHTPYKNIIYIVPFSGVGMWLYAPGILLMSIPIFGLVTGMILMIIRIKKRFKH